MRCLLRAVLPKHLDNGVMAVLLRQHERRIAVLRARAGEKKRYRGEGERGGRGSIANILSLCKMKEAHFFSCRHY